MKLLIPTRNRATSLAGVLGFLARFHPDTEVIVADGSDADIQPMVRAALPQGLRVDFRPYPADLPYFDRLLDVLTGLSDTCIVMGSDDDFPMMDVFAQGARILDQAPETVSVQALRLSLSLSAPGELHVRAFPAHPIGAAQAERRLAQYGLWPYPTTYGLTRRAHLVARYERARRGFVPGLYDFAVGAQDCIAGRIRVIPRLGFVTTRNYAHSYLRDTDPLFFLRQSEAVLDLLDDLRIDLEQTGTAAGIAATRAEQAVKRLIAAWCGAGPMTRAGFTEQATVQHPQVQTQIALQAALLRKGTSERAAHLDRLRHIVDALIRAASSQDNAGEPATYASLDAQSARSAAAASAAAATTAAHLARAHPGPLPLSHRMDPETLLARPEED